MSDYGRPDESWDLLVDASVRFLQQRAVLRRTTSYTELSATLARRTGLPAFDSPSRSSAPRWDT